MKIPAAFAPKSWEMPPGFRVLEDSASVVVRNFSGRTRRWTVAPVEISKLIRPILWMRPLDSNFDAGFVAFDCSYRQLTPSSSLSESSNLGATLTQLWQENRFARYFFCNERGNLRQESEAAQASLLIASNGLAAWNRAEVENFSDAIVFDWSSPLTNSEFLNLPAFELWKKVEDLLEEPNSKALFARNFAQMNENERYNTIFNGSCLSENEFKLLLRCLLLSQDFWTETNKELEVIVDTAKGGDIELDFILNFAYEQVELSDELAQNIRLLLSHHCRAQIPEEEIQGHSCVDIWLSGKPTVIEEVVRRPTAHEQLEAALRWRQWKANHEKL